MAVVANVAINVDAGSAVASLNAVAAAANKVAGAGTQAANKVGSSFKQLGSSLGSIKTAFSSLGAAVTAVGLTAFASQVAKTGIEADRTAKRIQLLAGNSQEAARIQAIAANAAREFGLGNLSASQGVADLYARLAPMGIATKDIETVFIGANKAALNMGLTSAESANAMLQLSQALGSGVLQGDEFRSISEQMPPILDAVAKVLNVNRSELKALASDGKITTDVLIQAMGELSKMNTVEPDSVRKFSAAMENLQVTIGTKLLPALTPLIEGLTGILNAFNTLPQPVQTAIVALGAVVAAIAILGPPISALISLVGTLGPAFAAIGSAIGAVSAAIAGSGGLTAAVGAIIAILTGPVGWIAALVAVGVAAYAFRDEIAEAFEGVLNTLKPLGDALYDFFVEPFISNFNFVSKGAQDLGKSIVESLTNIWPGIVNTVKNALNNIISLVEQAINSLVSKVNKVLSQINASLSKAGLPTIPLIGEAELPRLAKGGYVTKATTAIIGEGGEPEYVIPSSKMASAMANYAAGRRGSAVLSPQVNITTGPVTQMDGTNYVTMGDLRQATSAAARQGANLALSQLQSNPSLRRSIGVAR